MNEQEKKEDLKRRKKVLILGATTALFLFIYFTFNLITHSDKMIFAKENKWNNIKGRSSAHKSMVSDYLGCRENVRNTTEICKLSIISNAKMNNLKENEIKIAYLDIAIAINQ
jgi:hypothetical protein